MERKIIPVTVTSTTNLGAGVARDADGRVIFVDGAVEGDLAEVEITRVKSSYSKGRICTLTKPSRHRISSDCTAFDTGCGGCAFRHISYSHELEVKAGYIKSAFRKCGIDVALEPFLTAGENAVRSKATFQVSDGVSGYYASMTHSIIPSECCRLHDSETEAIRKYVTAARPLGLRRVTVRRASSGTMVILRFGDGADARSLPEEMMSNFPFVTSVWLEAGGNYRHLAGDKAIYDSLSGCRFKISPASFYQVNHDCAELLYNRAISAAGLSCGESVADLYCGTGTIGIAAASRVSIDLTGIEIVPEAVLDARENACANGITAQFICGDAAEYDGHADCVFLDPPRAGCSTRLLTHLSKMRSDRIVYVSCEPATLARDAASLVSFGYRIESVTPVDMFPRTGSVESVVCLTRKRVSIGKRQAKSSLFE